MIQSKADLLYYLEQDRFAVGHGEKHPQLFKDEVWKYEIILRKREYYKNVEGLFHPILERLYAFR